ncbi:ABC transporter ATP-binding protein [Micromonospora sp. WMMD882]|uniref:ABC transporter ATP-binding protein n=1 Tax=Micromonospora sp. WMMD882 TaxID=3015151 RepID=UPI00248C0780|nr:ABC transporter ATP-binding protein [Micromonospora sp. WMMD882]WBB77599.1 ABC transporter ATP-binding protein [Micromonospora sp. WMMD882]
MVAPAQVESSTASTVTPPPAAGPIVRVRNLSKRFRRADGAETKAVDDVSFDVARGEFLVLLGPSGCGKTTLLRMIAGLETPDAGTVEIDGQPVYDHSRRLLVPPEKRRISMIFQSYALWPHMTVAQNVAYPLENRAQKLSRPEIAARVQASLDQVHIGELGRQYPGQMSGGQQQRVALARALVAGNDLILFDEPLSNVDAKVREQLRAELVSMQRELGFAAVYVTHDQHEAMGLAHRIAVMGEGRFAQLGGPRDIYHDATSRYVANFVGTSNELPGDVTGPDAAGLATVRTALGPVRGRLGSDQLRDGDQAIALFRPERAHIAPATDGTRPGPAAGASAGDSDGATFTGTLKAALFFGPHTEYTVACGEHVLRVWSNTRSELPEGSTVEVTVDAADVRILQP